MRPLYALQDVSCFYGNRRVLRVDRLKIAAGQTLGLIGPNGSGKSTLLKTLAFLHPCGGTLGFDGTPGQERRDVTLLLQEPFLLKRSVYDNIAYGLKVRGGIADCEHRVYQALDMVALPRSFARRWWNELSGGEAQRVALASRLALRPRVLLLDEPTANVDERSENSIRTAIATARSAWGTTLVVATHDWEWIDRVADALLMLVNGNIIGHGVMNFLTRENVPCVLGEAPGVPSDVGVLDPSDIVLVAAPLAESRMESGLCRIPGKIVRLSLEQSRGALLVFLDCALKIRVFPQQDPNLQGLLPGMEVCALFASSSIRWL